MFSDSIKIAHLILRNIYVMNEWKYIFRFVENSLMNDFLWQYINMITITNSICIFHTIWKSLTFYLLTEMCVECKVYLSFINYWIQITNCLFITYNYRQFILPCIKVLKCTE